MTSSYRQNCLWPTLVLLVSIKAMLFLSIFVLGIFTGNWMMVFLEFKLLWKISTLSLSQWPASQKSYPVFSKITWQEFAIQSKSQHLVSGQYPKKTWPQWVVYLGTRYGHVILVSGCFDRCQLIITCMPNIKEVHCKPRLHVSFDLLFEVWPPCWATPPPSSWLSHVRAQEQCRYP